MMKRAILSGMLLLACLFLSAQATQKVRVMEYNGKQQKTPLATVEVSVANAGSTISDAKGEATLRFRTLKAGDRVQVKRIGKDGYEIFNKDALKQWMVSGSTTFTIVLCKTASFKKLCDNYNRAASASYEAQYKKEQNKLAAERKAGKLKEEEYKQKLQQLEDDYAQQLEDLEKYVDAFARIDLSEISEQEQKIIDLVQEGKIDEAIKRYEELDLLSKYQQQSKEIKNISDAEDSLKMIRDEKQAAVDTLKRVIDLMQQ